MSDMTVLDYVDMLGEAKSRLAMAQQVLDGQNIDDSLPEQDKEALDGIVYALNDPESVT